jgi:hypothetical protein
MNSIPKGFFHEQICSLREKSLRKRDIRNPNKAISAWIEEDHLLSGPGKALVIILNSRGCSWAKAGEGGCSMCGYSNETSDEITAANLIAQVENALPHFIDKQFQAVKLFNSGSFLDLQEVPLKSQTAIIEKLSHIPQVEEIIIESRPEYVHQNSLETLLHSLDESVELEIGIGLESSSDTIRIDIINKGFTYKDFLAAVKVARKQAVRVKSYLLLKPPFLTEQEAIKDTINSAIASIKAGAQSISINPLNVQYGTFVHELWKDNLYRPPWFWTVKATIQGLWERIAQDGLSSKVDRILCDPSGSGKNKGVHNACRKCNKQFPKILKRYSVLQDPAILDQITCSCSELWEEIVSLEACSRDFSLRKMEHPGHFF